MRVGFIGLGNVGAKLAGSLLRNGMDLIVRDLDPAAAQPLLDAGAAWGESPASMTEQVDLMITCLPSPAISAAIVEGDVLNRSARADVRRIWLPAVWCGSSVARCPLVPRSFANWEQGKALSSAVGSLS